MDAARAPRRREAAGTAVASVPLCAPAGRSAAMGREGVCGWRVACVFAYGGASAVAAWGLSLLVACVHCRTAAVVRVHPSCCLLPCMYAHAHDGHAVPAKGCMHVAVCSWLCTPNTSPGMHFTHTTLRHAYICTYMHLCAPHYCAHALLLHRWHSSKPQAQNPQAEFGTRPQAPFIRTPFRMALPHRSSFPPYILLRKPGKQAVQTAQCVHCSGRAHVIPGGCLCAYNCAQ